MTLQKISPKNGKIIIAALAAFCVYTCMYAYRKPFTVADFGSYDFLGVDYKIWLVVSQTIGYTLSKFFGIRFIAEVKCNNRFRSIISFIALGWSMLLLFAIVPAPYNIVFLLFNGFFLGVIYGLVFSYLEGRTTTEFLGAVLASSFIFASGFTQSVGKYLLQNWEVNNWWMPFVTGFIFFLPLLFFTWLLNRTPAPDSTDVMERTLRRPMGKKERRKFVSYFFSGLVLLTLTYVMLTMVRDYRSNFASNMWKELGFANDASVYTTSELLPSIVVLVIASSLIFIKNNFRAFIINHVLILAGCGVCIVSSLLFLQKDISPFAWMTLTGTGLYMSYVPFNSMLFERLMASFKYAGTVGFIIYVADSFGYLGSCLILFVKNFSTLHTTWVSFFLQMTIYGGVAGIVLTIISIIYFIRKYKRKNSSVEKESNRNRRGYRRFGNSPGLSIEKL